MKRSTLKFCARIATFAVFISGAFAQGIYFVDAVNGNDTNVGTTWTTAFRTLQKGIDVAAGYGSEAHVLVREGLYGPPQVNSSGDIDLKNDVHVHGGFLNSTTYFDPDGSFLQTFIQGVDLIQGIVDQDPESLVESIGNVNAVLDGFLVQGGDQDVNDNHSGYGGAFYCQSPEDVRLENITFKNNWAENGGGAVSLTGGYQSENGVQSFGLEVDRCTFYQNRVGTSTGLGEGGAIFLGPDFTGSGVQICNAILYDNGSLETTAGGGGIYYSRESFSIVANTLIHNNLAQRGGGVCIEPDQHEFDDINPAPDEHEFTNCTISKNACAVTSAGEGIHMDVSGSGPTAHVWFLNGIAYGNTTGYDLYREVSPIGIPFVRAYSDFRFQFNTIDGGGNISLDPRFVDAAGGNFRLKTQPVASPCIDAGLDSYLPPDFANLDEDLDLIEILPLDLDLARRKRDYYSGSEQVDMGAYEVAN